VAAISSQQPVYRWDSCFELDERCRSTWGHRVVTRQSFPCCWLFFTVALVLAYVYNGCLAWYNVVLTPWIHSTVNWGKVLCRQQATNASTRGKNGNDNKQRNIIVF